MRTDEHYYAPPPVGESQFFPTRMIDFLPLEDIDRERAKQFGLRMRKRYDDAIRGSR